MCSVGNRGGCNQICSAYSHKETCPAFYRQEEKPKFLRDPKKVKKFIEALRRA